MFSSLSRGPALSIPCTLDKRGARRSSLPVPPANHCTGRAFLHEGHTLYSLYSNLEVINSPGRVVSSVQRSTGRRTWGSSPGVPECRVTERASPPRAAPGTAGHCLGTQNPNPARDPAQGREIPTLMLASAGFKTQLSHSFAVTDGETSQGNL